MAFDVGTAVGYLDLDTSGFTKGFARARADMKTFSDKNATFNDKLAATGSIMKNVGSTMTKWVTLPLVGVGTAAIKTAANFESGMSAVAAISGATGTQLDQLTDKAMEMGAKTKFSASEAAEAMQYMAMASWKTEDMLVGIEGIMSLAAASGEDLATTSDIVTDALTAFGLAAGDAGWFSDVLAAASSNANTNVGMLGESFKYVAPVAGAMGYSVQDTAIALGLMANSGIKASQGGTALRGSLTKLIKPTGDAAAIMDEYGISLTNTDGSMKSLGDVMGMLREKLGGLSKAQQTQVATTLFGQEAMSGMLAIINASEADYNKLTDAIYGSKDAATNMANAMQDNLSGQLTILGSTIEGIAISFGNILLPMIKKVVEGLQGFASWINGLSDSQKEFIAEILMWAAALGPVMLIMGKLIGSILSVTKYFKGLGVIFSAGKGIISALFGPLTSLLSLLGSIFTRVLPLQKAFTGLTSVFTRLTPVLTGCGRVFSSLVSPFSSLFSVIGNFLLKLPLVQKLGTYFSGVTAAFSAGKSAILSLLGPTGSLILIIAAIVAAVVALKAAWDTNFGGIQEKTAEIVTSVQSMFDSMISMLQSWGNFFLGLWESNWLGIQSIFTTLWNRVEVLFSLGLDILNEVFQLFSNLFQGNWSEAWQNVVNIFTGIVKGIALFFAAGLEALVTLLVNIGESLWEAARTAFGFISDGFTQVWDQIVAWFEIAKEDPVTAIEGIASSLYEAGKTVISKLWDGLKAAWEEVASWAEGIASWLTNILSVTADVTVNTHRGSSGSFASGLDYVPRDMVVKVHEGESIRTKQQTREDYSRSSGGDTFNFYSPEPIDEMEAAKQMKRAKRDLAEGF